MKTKVIALSLAGVMSVQSFAMANSVDRVGNVGDAQINQAGLLLIDLSTRLNSLDKILEKAATEIEATEHDTASQIFNGAGVVAAVGGLGVALLGAFTVLKGGAGSGTGYILNGVLGTVLNSASLALEVTGQQLASDADMTDALKAVNEANKQVSESLTQTMDPGLKVSFLQLELSLANMENSIANYSTDKNQDSKANLHRDILKGAGIVMTVAGMVGPIGSSNASITLMKLGAVGTSVANLLSISHLRSGVDTAKILSEISLTRKQIQIASSVLK
jgi:hypothetical protein